MRMLGYEMLVSLDGYYEDTQGGFGWAAPDAELHAYINSAQARYDTYLFGRRMYEVMQFWDNFDSAGAPPAEAEFARLWKSKRKLVASRTLPALGPGAELVDGDLIAAVKSLKSEAGAAISVGGAVVASELIEAGLVDEMTVYVMPVAVGGGKPFWPAGLGPVPLALLEQRQFASGAVMLRYALTGS